MFNYSNKTALITGASSGIGEAFAHSLAAKKCNLILVARNQVKLNALAAELSAAYKIKATVIVLDLSTSGASQALLHEVQKHHLKVDLLINNAGFATYGYFEQVSAERQHEEVMLNVAALVDITHAFMPDLLRNRDGGLINVSSTAAFQPDPYMAVYGASKAFVLSFSEALWAENRKRGLKVLALCPGATDTSFFDIVGSNEASVGSRQTPEAVVTNALRALEQGRSHIISGRQNYLVAQVSRFFSRHFTLGIVERTLRPRN
ncbi:SDR family NAD(P)-dependent oxidoreductase [Paenibacillus sp. LMG 31456]|uniref:SDR family NAD(P)-dependent oxidoreductase n=1 Tax=Paenibacillus foliorum TaxID=2654974 RepID=A0A972K2T6_9BACL|nr:SDR family oxidoreductase [Paenibacillus foliorum]NOU98094.1 SDR family NAD(P)-dependent oxidoreductase [Paenibacillus foliorum]